jgi:hypothetical protein
VTAHEALKIVAWGVAAGVGAWLLHAVEFALQARAFALGLWRSLALAGSVILLLLAVAGISRLRMRKAPTIDDAFASDDVFALDEDAHESSMDVSAISSIAPLPDRPSTRGADLVAGLVLAMCVAAGTALYGTQETVLDIPVDAILFAGGCTAAVGAAVYVFVRSRRRQPRWPGVDAYPPYVPDDLPADSTTRVCVCGCLVARRDAVCRTCGRVMWKAQFAVGLMSMLATFALLAWWRGFD